MNTNLTDVTVILDKSTSMNHLVDATIEGYNAFKNQQAEAQAWCDAYDLRQATPLRDRALAAAHRMTGAEAMATMHRQIVLAHKPTLTDADKSELRTLNTAMMDHPRGCFPYKDLIAHCLNSGIEWLETYIQVETWGWGWWADHFNQSVEQYGQGLTASEVAYIKAHPHPAGWAPEARR